MAREEPVEVMIATPLEEALVREIEGTDHRIKLLYEPELLPPARYPADHRGDPDFRRDAAQKERWNSMLEKAEVIFGLPGESASGLADAIRRGGQLKWVQATNAGTGEQVQQADLSPEDLERVAITTASGVHAGPLAEFCMFGILAFTKNLPRLLKDKEQRRWERHPARELRGRTLLVIGLGNIGVEVARLAKSFGMRSVGLKRHPDEEIPHLDEVRSQESLEEAVPEADAIVATLPLTEETRGMIGREIIDLMKPECIFVNVGRGSVVDEAALTEALEERRIAGAALDVFQSEPLPSDSPLWELPNVLVSPHTAALSEAENRRIVELFQKNLSLYLDGEELMNRVDPTTFY